jgi:hypothetical protein
MPNEDSRSNNHWNMETYRQRMTTKEWKQVLLNEGDRIIFQGRLRQLKAKRLGAGVVEIYKEPLKET